MPVATEGPRHTKDAGAFESLIATEGARAAGGSRAAGGARAGEGARATEGAWPIWLVTDRVIQGAEGPWIAPSALQS